MKPFKLWYWKNIFCIWSRHRLGWCATCKRLLFLQLYLKERLLWTLEQDLEQAFHHRGGIIQQMKVAKRATEYTIKVKWRRHNED